MKVQGLPSGGVTVLLLQQRGMDTAEIEREIARRDERLARRGSPPGRPDGPPGSGLNENYARELLELHTLGVDGGYTQQDIVEVARCFTGWTLLPLPAGQQFVFVEELHERGKKVVLGKKIKGKGMAEGEAVLDLLASHPSTARFISTKLARRFVSDDPPHALVEAMAATFLETDGDIRAVLRTMLASDEFWSPDAVNAKVKTPFEFVTSAVRATGAEIQGPPRTVPPGEGVMSMDPGAMRQAALRPGLLRAMQQLGQPLYGAQPPTGYDDIAGAWVSTGALLNRMKFALGLAGNRLPGVRTTLPPEVTGEASPEAMLERLGERLLGVPPSAETLRALERQLALDPAEMEALGLPRRLGESAVSRARLGTGWLLASAEFQRR
jgi:uncharacterized protein (DUF1800 family)